MVTLEPWGIIDRELPWLEWTAITDEQLNETREDTTALKMHTNQMNILK